MKSHFANNLSLLSRLDPELASRMKALPFPSPQVTGLESRSGQPTLKATSHDGVEILLHSEYDPVREANQFWETRKPAKADGYVLNGFGLGFLALEVVQRVDDKRPILCLEAYEDLFRAALEYTDLSPLLTRKNVAFWVGRDWVGFQSWLRTTLNRMGLPRLTFLTYPPCSRIFPEFYEAIGVEIENAINTAQINLNTLVVYGRAMERNILQNFPVVARSHGVKAFAGQFRGLPAIVVGAGPSLTAALPYLREAQGKAVIIAVGKTLRLLLAENIVPQFVATLDMSEKIAPCLRGFDIPRDVVHVYDPDCFHEVPAEFPGRSVTFETDHRLTRWARAFLGDRGSVDKGLSVAHTAFYFAHAAGASPIMLVGVDMAFPSENTHAAGVTPTWGGKVEDLKKMHWIMVPGTQGKPVRTNPSFFAFVTTFEVGVMRTGAKLVQTSEIGAMVRGAEYLPLPEALARYATKEAPIKDLIDGVFARPPHFSGEAFQTASRSLIEGIEGVVKHAESGLDLLRSLKSRDPGNRLDREEMRKKVSRLNLFKQEIEKSPQVTECFNRLMVQGAHEARQLERDAEETTKDSKEWVVLCMKYFEVIFQAYLDAALYYRDEVRSMTELMLQGYAGK